MRHTVTNLGDWTDKGDGTLITDIAIKVDKGSVRYGYQKAQYRVSFLEGREYYDWQYDNETHSG